MKSCFGNLFTNLADEVSDEENVQTRALNFIIGVLHCRGAVEPECLHPTWGDFKRAVAATRNLQAVSLKATYLANYGAGPFLTGRGRVDLATAAASLMEQCSDEQLREWAEHVQFDRSDNTFELAEFTRADFLESDIVQRRTPFEPRHSYQECREARILKWGLGWLEERDGSTTQLYRPQQCLMNKLQQCSIVLNSAPPSASIVLNSAWVIILSRAQCLVQNPSQSSISTISLHGKLKSHPKPICAVGPSRADAHDARAHT